MESASGGSGSSYLAWNDAIAAHFFRRAFADQPVYLFVTETLITELGRALDGDVDAFVAAVRAGPPGVTRAGLCQRALQAAADWRNSQCEYPPYLAYLALFVLAGGHEGEFAQHAYYPRLWDLLGERGTGSPPSFDRMVELWDDLEQWSLRDRDGELGAFQARIVGEWVHVGLPLAQTVLTEAERLSLPRIFAAAELEPGMVPSSRELRRALTTGGRSSGLRPRTLSALENVDGTFGAAILDVAAEAFQSWNGESPVAVTGQSASTRVSAGLRWCLALDRIAGRLIGSLRCRSQRELPELGLHLISDHTGSLSCSEFVVGWSTPLIHEATGQPFRPPGSAWSSGLTLTDSAAGWRLSLRPARARAFVEATGDGLPGLVEVLELPRSRPFYLAFPSSALPVLTDWLDGGCRGWRPIEIVEGLPNGWVFGGASEALTDTGLRQVEPRLGFTDRLSIRIIGGVRAGAGNSYLLAAPPQIAVHGAAEGDSLSCAGRPVASGLELEQAHPLPGDLPEDTRVALQVQRGDATLGRSSIYLLSGFPWRLAEPIATLDRYGRPDHDEQGVTGALVPGNAEENFAPDLLRTPGLDARCGSVYFLGRAADQVAHWPRDPMPEWSPVWAIAQGAGRGRAFFCGTSIFDSEPRRASGRASGRRARTWVNLLGRQRRIVPPQDRDLKILWRRYREVARALR